MTTARSARRWAWLLVSLLLGTLVGVMDVRANNAQGPLLFFVACAFMLVKWRAAAEGSSVFGTRPRKANRRRAQSRALRLCDS